MDDLAGLVLVAALVFLGCACRSTRINDPNENTKTTQPTPDPTRKTVCIDPGHPSEVNSGATVQNGTTEVHVAWMVALKLRQLLEAEGLNVVMTKSREDELVKNRERAEIANRSGAALMVRLHCDASADEGFALYAPDQQATRDGVTGPPQAVIGASRLLAQTIDTEMAKRLSGVLKDGGVRGDSVTAVGSKQGALTGSIFSRIPVVTIEMVVLSNRADAEFIKSEAGEQRMAQAIADGIKAFVAHPSSSP